MRLKFWKKSPEVLPTVVQEKNFNEEMIHLPAKYPKPAKSFLTILYPGGGSTIMEVKEISAEEIILPDKTKRYTGVAPDLTYHRLARRRLGIRKHWETIRMHYTMFGWPFTFNPKTFEIFSSEKKRRILIARGAGIPVEVGDRTVVVLIDPATQNTKDPRPIWQPEEITVEERKKLFKEKAPETFFDLETWVKANLEKLDAMETIQLPVATIYDVDNMEMLVAETFHFIENQVIEKGFKSMEQLGEEKSLFWMYVLCLGAVILTMVVFLYYGNEGAFA